LSVQRLVPESLVQEKEVAMTIWSIS